MHRKRRTSTRPMLSLDSILRWADRYFRMHRKWPTAYAGVVRAIDSPADLNWRKIDNALRYGSFGLPRGNSLALIFQEHRGRRNNGNLPRLTANKILEWADEHHARTGSWPNLKSGVIAEAPGEKWANIDAALSQGMRGLLAGSSLAKLLARRRGVRNRANQRLLSIEVILCLADAHNNRTGHWPTRTSGPVAQLKDETWQKIDSALMGAHRGIAEPTSLAEVLRVHRGRRHYGRLPQLTEGKILEWATAHMARNGKWPNSTSGRVLGAPGESWSGINLALWQGLRGFSGGSSLAKLLQKVKSLNGFR